MCAERRGGLRGLIDSWRRILKLARKPDKEEFSVLLKLNLLGFTLIGAISYLIHIIATVIAPAIAG
ncbi:MAG: protein translocase SEC61 complex subunit gamma [Desulfurococcales archaeon]|jgi:protein transport protein SEC61 subunit gamma-like protein|uniref:Protein translocase subunit SecE n=1 Tax=Fervidicoccus fontis TaxID=683846 RepID=A0A7C1E8J5_9CREN|nr:protein translocase SEC61 complex subunit gamma [Fervidicoccaceae archaeon]NAZ12233.1 protein translocase SEC61 complex subunit gamma [Desulfurococcales archaeon]